jgi:tripartite-type tricarboxylate transporter receptor subunit TctC
MVAFRALIAFAALAVAPLTAHAQDWPNRPVRFIVPYPAGGSTDVGARLIGDHIARALGQQIVVENKSGGSGNIGFEAAAKSAADGYTVLIARSGDECAARLQGEF